MLQPPTRPDGRAARTVAAVAVAVLVAGLAVAVVPGRAGAAGGAATVATDVTQPAAVPTAGSLDHAPAPATAPGPAATAPPGPVPQPPAPPAPAPVAVAAAPAPAPPAPAPQPAAPTAAPEPPTTDLDARIREAFVAAVPAGWREGMPARLQVIGGSTSYATGPDLIRIGDGPASGSWPHLLSVIAHEYGHLIAFRYGSGAYAGAAPEGWPDPGYSDPAESWADCVAQAFTGVIDPSYDLPPCPPHSVDWTARWLAGEI